MTVQAALVGKKNEKKARRSVFSKCSYLYLKTLLIKIPTGKCNIACFVIKLTKTICNSLVLCLPTKMGTKKSWTGKFISSRGGSRPMRTMLMHQSEILKFESLTLLKFILHRAIQSYLSLKLKCI